ncbi:MAG: hypothetical protein ACLPND_07110 [Candidatus Korobacteraceae bacterium]
MENGDLISIEAAVGFGKEPGKCGGVQAGAGRSCQPHIPLSARDFTPFDAFERH